MTYVLGLTGGIASGKSTVSKILASYGAEIIDGQNACPPEDVGGTEGYASMLKSLANPEDEEREDYIHWLNRDFDPNRFNLYEARKRVWDFQRVIGEARWGFYHQ